MQSRPQDTVRVRQIGAAGERCGVRASKRAGDGDYQAAGTGDEQPRDSRRPCPGGGEGEELRFDDTLKAARRQPGAGDKPGAAA